MGIIKKFYNFINENLLDKITIYVYDVTAHTESSSEYLDSTFNKEDAFNIAELNENEYRGYDIMITEYKKEFTIEELLELSDIDKEEYISDDMTLDDIMSDLEPIEIQPYISENNGEYDVIHVIYVDRVNQKSDDLIDKVKDILATELRLSYFSKYQDLKVDKEGNLHNLSIDIGE